VYSFSITENEDNTRVRVPMRVMNVRSVLSVRGEDSRRVESSFLFYPSAFFAV